MSERPDELELTALESALRGLRPRPETIDRAALMYRAGRASARGWGWPLAAMLSTSAALALGIAGWLRPAPTVVERTVYVATPDQAAPEPRDGDAPAPEVPSSTDDAEPGAWSGYVRLQEKLLRDGLDGLPAPPSAPEKPPSLEALLRSL